MRAAAIAALALLLSSCGASVLQQNAMVAQVTRDLIDQVGATVNAAAHVDYVAAGGEAMDAAHRAALSARYAPIKEGYARASNVLAAYEQAIADGDINAVHATAQALVQVWTQLAASSAASDVHVVPVPAVLVRLSRGATP